MFKWGFTFLMITLSLPVFGDSSNPDLIEKIDETKNIVSKAEKKQRKIYRQVLESDLRVKKMSEERSKVNEKILSSQADAQELAYEVRLWTQKVKEQRARIAKSVAHLYQLKNPSVLTFLFSDQSASEIERNVRFLKKASESDFKRFQTYRVSLTKAKKANDDLKAEVRKLLGLKNKLKVKEAKLLADQREKNLLIKLINKNKEKNLELLKKLRSQLPELDQDAEVAFFEKKGELYPPLPQAPWKEYGSTFDPIYKVKLLHLGWTYNALRMSTVKSVFDGKVAYVGPIPGFGQTVILDHGNHYYSVYSYNIETKVFEGEKVFKGQTLALSGNQLYFELRHYSNAIDPEKWIANGHSEDVAGTSFSSRGDQL